MNWKNLFSFRMLKSLVLWNPVAVDKPRPKFIEYKGVGCRLLGYEVVVKYENNKQRIYLFMPDEKNLGNLSRKYAYKRALNFYNKKLEALKKDKQK